MERKRIILLATSDINYDQRVLKVANTLHELGADVSVLGRELPSSVKLVKRPFKQFRVRCLFNSGVLFYLEITLRFFLKLMSNSYDIVCANDPDTLLAATKAKAFKKMDLVYDSHEYFIEVTELQGKKVKQKIWETIERNGVKKAMSCYTVNHTLASIFKERFNKEFEVIHNAPVLELSSKNTHEEKYILYQGALNKGRGLEALICAMSDIPIPLRIAGKGDLEKELKELSNKMGLKDKVTFLGNLLPEELRSLTSKAWLGINLLESKSLNYYYSLANKFFDYMHADVPSLNMDFPEYKSILSDWKVGITIESLDSKMIALKINELLNDEKGFAAMRSSCHEAKLEFNWQKEAAKLKLIYKL